MRSASQQKLFCDTYWASSASHILGVISVTHIGRHQRHTYWASSASHILGVINVTHNGRHQRHTYWASSTSHILGVINVRHIGRHQRHKHLASSIPGCQNDRVLESDRKGSGNRGSNLSAGEKYVTLRLSV
ncbi:hypothetical protein BaRGS_00007214 [Batillaria attramentaria]|uniref:Uncharacterized protein n=1 Tax=Batillaria attramentaria TaxID=370345 RepID=A0ABD0LPE8_9CAEN